MRGGNHDNHPAALGQHVGRVAHSDQAAIPAGAQRFVDALTAPKQIEWLDGTQFDFDDDDAHIDTAVDLAPTSRPPCPDPHPRTPPAPPQAVSQLPI